MIVVVWSGVGNISFSYENELVWIWFGFVPICRLSSAPRHYEQGRTAACKRIRSLARSITNLVVYSLNADDAVAVFSFLVVDVCS